MFKLWLRRRFRSRQRVILHCRGATAANLALRATESDDRFRVIFDCRGLDAPEFLYVQGYRSVEEAPEHLAREASQRDDIQRQAALSCHAMVCVSEAMKREVMDSWSVPAEKIRVIPCCTDVEAGARAYAGREALRRQLGFSGKLVVAYCGSLEPWQMPAESLAVFRWIASIRPDAHLLAITTHAARMEAFADQAGIKEEQRTIVSLPHTAVPAYLAAADVALLIRADSLVNRVASPVKFAEYLSCGVPVILTEGVGDCSALVHSGGVGCVLPARPLDASGQAILEELVRSIATDRISLAERCRDWARTRLDIRSTTSLLAALYAQISRDNGHAHR